MSSLSATNLLAMSVRHAEDLVQSIQATHEVACESDPLLATVLTDSITTAAGLAHRLNQFATALRCESLVPTMAEIDQTMLLAARDWLNANQWAGCPMTVEPTNDEQRRDIEESLAAYYAGGIAGFVANFRSGKGGVL